jgi:hypothetical protein
MEINNKLPNPAPAPSTDTLLRVILNTIAEADEDDNNVIAIVLQLPGMIIKGEIISTKTYKDRASQSGNAHLNSIVQQSIDRIDQWVNESEKTINERDLSSSSIDFKTFLPVFIHLQNATIYVEGRTLTSSLWRGSLLHVVGYFFLDNEPSMVWEWD